MKKGVFLYFQHYKKITAMIFLIGILITFLPSASGILIPKTNLELYLENELIVMAEVISFSDIEDESNASPRTAYEIKILQSIKGNTQTNEMKVMGFGSLNSTLRLDNQVFLSEGQQALLMLNKLIDGFYYISPYSNYSDSVNPDLNFILAPQKLYKAGIPADDIHCKSSLKMAFKSSNDLPVCIKPESVDRLLDRGWIR